MTGGPGRGSVTDVASPFVLKGNTFYGKRTHSMGREHILYKENTFYSDRRCIALRIGR